ncbi:MAG: transposase [Nitrososphaerota archaeon]|jgi:hypothetical protein|nr:transposase [Nitrososphaerota archaeon]
MQVAGYMGRYLRQPAIAESRISGFNVETIRVTFWYMDKHRVKQFVTLHV